MEQPGQLRAPRSAEFVIASPSPILVIASRVVCWIGQVKALYGDIESDHKQNIVDKFSIAKVTVGGIPNTQEL
jgi:hypothetical protein